MGSSLTVNPAVTAEVLPRNSSLITNEHQLREVNRRRVNVPLLTVNHPMIGKDLSEGGVVPFTMIIRQRVHLSGSGTKR